MMGVRGDDRMISTITTGALPVYQDPQELKRKRNRLAQRKHRSRLATGPPAGNGSHGSHGTPEETSAAGRISSTPAKGAMHQPWEASVNPLHFNADHAGHIVSAMDFSLPECSENMSDGVNMPDPQHNILPISNEVFDNFEAAYPLEDLGVQQKMIEEAYKVLLPQNDSYMVSHATRRQPPPYESGLTRSSPMEAEPQDLQPRSRRNHSFQGCLSSSDVAKPSHDCTAPRSDQTSSRGNQDSSDCNTGPSPPSTVDGEASSEQSARLRTPDPLPGAEDLEARFEHIIHVIEEAGFESIDDMSTQYYTANFKEDTLSYWAQSRSRSRSLPSFLASLHASTEKWPSREVQGYRQQITEAAESLYVSELVHVSKDITQSGDNPGQPLTPVSPSSLDVKSLWRIIADLEVSPDFKQKKTVIREMMPETWSLLAELARKAELRQPQASQAVCAFLLLLLEPDQSTTRLVSRTIKRRVTST